MFSDSVLRTLANQINERFKTLNRRQVIESQILKNEGLSDGIWPLNYDDGVDTIPSGVRGKVKTRSYGKSIIDGRLYALSQDCRQLVEVGGSSNLSIQKMQAHVWRTSGWGTDSVYVAIGNELVTKEYLEGNFNLLTLGTGDNSKCAMKYKSSQLANVSCEAFGVLNYGANFYGTKEYFWNLLNKGNISSSNYANAISESHSYIKLDSTSEEENVYGPSLDIDDEFDIMDSANADSDEFVTTIGSWADL